MSNNHHRRKLFSKSTASERWYLPPQHVLFILLMVGLIGTVILLHQKASSLTTTTTTASTTISTADDYPKEQQQQQQQQQQNLMDKSTIQETKNEHDSFMLSCLQQTLLEEMPLSKTKKKMQRFCPNCDVAYAHHWDAGHVKLWAPSVEYRLKPVDALDQGNKHSNCTVWEVGAHKKADDSKSLMKLYDQCQYHAFEPIPNFSTILRRNWANEPRMTVHSYGIGKEDSSFTVPEEVLQGQATYIADHKTGEQNTGTITAQIKSFDYVLNKAGGIPTLLHINCEGCEWDFLVDAKQHGFLEQVPVIQVGWHNYGEVGLGTRVWQLCEIRKMLSETHIMTSGLAFGWDRWERKH